MYVVACARELRRRARRALGEGRYHEAHELAGRAQELHRTPVGHEILQMAWLLGEVYVQP